MSEEVILLQNSNIAIEVGDNADIYDFLYDKHLAKESFEIWELDEQDEIIRTHNLDGQDIEFTNKNEDAIVSKQLRLENDFVWKQEYRLKKDEPLKWRSVFTDLSGRERRICMVKVWELDRKKFDRFTAYETSFKGVQLITPDWQPPYEFNGWKVSFGNSEIDELITEEFKNEFETWFLPKTRIEVTEDKIICKFIYYYVVQPWWVIDLDPTTYTYSTITSYDGYVYQTTDAYGNPYWVEDTTSVTITFGFSATAYGRAFIEFNVTAIPDDCTVTKDTLRYDAPASDHTVNAIITSMQGRPTGMAASSIHTTIGSGTQLVDSATFPVTGTNQEEDLGATGVSELQGKLSGNWFALGFKNKTETANLYKYIRSSESTGTPKPTLYVEFTLPQNIVAINEVSWSDISEINGVSKALIRDVMGVWSG